MTIDYYADRYEYEQEEIAMMSRVEEDEAKDEVIALLKAALINAHKHMLEVCATYPEEEWIQDPITYSEGDHGKRIYLFQQIEEALTRAAE